MFGRLYVLSFPVPHSPSHTCGQRKTVTTVPVLWPTRREEQTGPQLTPHPGTGMLRSAQGLCPSALAWHLDAPPVLSSPPGKGPLLLGVRPRGSQTSQSTCHPCPHSPTQHLHEGLWEPQASKGALAQTVPSTQNAVPSIGTGRSWASSQGGPACGFPLRWKPCRSPQVSLMLSDLLAHCLLTSLRTRQGALREGPCRPSQPRTHSHPVHTLAPRAHTPTPPIPPIDIP